MKKERLYLIIEEFVKCIYVLNNINKPSLSWCLMYSFPWARCFDASYLLSRYLKEIYDYDMNIKGKDGGSICWNHYFLENGDYVIDITASQFNKFWYNFPEIVILNQWEDLHIFENNKDSLEEYIREEYDLIDNILIKYYDILIEVINDNMN